MHHQALPHPEPAAPQDEAASYLECASCLLVTSQGNASAEAAAKEAGLPIIRLQLTPAGDSGMPKLVVQVDGGAAAPAAAVPAAPLPTDPALMLFTSGTTGKPKQVPITHGARLLMLRADTALADTATQMIKWLGRDSAGVPQQLVMQPGRCRPWERPTGA